MSKKPRVAIFCEGRNNYMALALGLEKGFSAVGCETFAGFSLLDSAAISCFVDYFRPDVVIELNRSRNQIIGLDEPFCHVSWVLDMAPWGRSMRANFGGSDMTYLISEPHILDIRIEDAGRWSYLLPGFDPNIFYPGFSNRPWDLSMIGHLNNPITTEERNITINMNDKSICDLGAIIDDVAASGFRLSNCDGPQLRNLLSAILKRYNFSNEISEVPNELFLFIFERVLRMDRVHLLQSIVRETKNVRFFGFGGWNAWPELAPYYYGPIFKTTQKAEIHRLSRVGIHNGRIGTHERVMEGLGSGTVMMINHHDVENTPTGIATHFIPGEDFIFYNIEDAGYILRKILDDETLCQRVGENARKKMLDQHTWSHRAVQILEDIGFI